MNFFEHQDRARRSSGRIVVLFLASVLVVLAFTNAIGVFVYKITSPAESSVPTFLFGVPFWVFATATVATLLVIAFGTWARMHVLAEGGTGLAQMIGARRLRRGTPDPLAQRVLNVVEEMAIAAGINVPEIFVLDDEPAVNALAAGHTPNEAVIIVTRGALEKLDRAELQGMMAHEFSHILNGDIRVNLRVVGVIAGITLLGGLGRAYAMNQVFFLVAVPLWVVGLAGTFTGQCVRAALSREREFLADAAAVQFTRDPMGIAGALWQMHRTGAVVSERHSEELEHMYLGEPRRYRFAWMSSHPPVEQRLERILGPGWRVLVRETVRRDAAPAAAAPAAPAAPAAEAAAVPTTALALLGSVGQLTAAHFDLARELLARLGPDLRESASTPQGAAALVLALFLGNRQTRAARLAALGERAGDAERFAVALDGMDPRLRLPLFELAVPTLKEESQAARDALFGAATAMVASGTSASLHDFVLLTLCRRHLGAHVPGPVPQKYQSIVPVAEHAVTVVSLVAHGAGSGEGAFHRAMTLLGLTGRRLRPATELKYPVVQSALYELRLLSPPRKALLVQACFGVAFTDEAISVAEGELLRAVCAAVDSPLPPLLAQAA
jgi:Zn-dependent protease with chaperone function